MKSLNNIILKIEKYTKSIKQKINKNKKMLLTIFASTFIIGLISYLFIFINPNYSHDGLSAIYQINDDNWKISLGRFLQPFVRIHRGYFNLTWLVGIISLINLSLASFFICKTMEFKEKKSWILTSFIITLNISIALTFITYSHEGDMFTLSILLASLSVYILNKYKKGFIFGSLLVMMTMGLYQAYLSIIICLVMLLTIKKLINNDNYKDIFIFVIKGIIMTGIGGILYIISLKAVLLFNNMHLQDNYNGLGNIRQIALRDILNLLGSTYETFFNSFKLMFSTSNLFTGIFYILITLLIIISLLLLRQKKIPLISFIMIFIIIGIYPIFSDLSEILSNGFVHMLMTYSCFLILLLAIIIYENCSFKIDNINISLFKNIICILLITLLYRNVVYTNTLSLKKYFNDRISLTTMNRIVDDIENFEEFNKSKDPIYFIGKLDDSKYLDVPEGFKKFTGTGITNRSGVTYDDVTRSFLRYNLAYDTIQISIEDVNKKIDKADKIIKKMPAFPKKGYIQYINGVMIVKLADEK